MVGTDEFLDMIGDPDFKILVAQLLALLSATECHQRNSNIACDALQYVNALIHEASPDNDGPEGLRDAHRKISTDTMDMLSFIREASLRQGKPVLFSMVERPTLN